MRRYGIASPEAKGDEKSATVLIGEAKQLTWRLVARERSHMRPTRLAVGMVIYEIRVLASRNEEAGQSSESRSGVSTRASHPFAKAAVVLAGTAREAISTFELE
ncbi:uncharacterized protein ColSpa_05174 [Colletotrichum spaethianum]|uniref:Uncharacterized protein n=1 Tax=Colletotrichum spaethianum TaxID=700344 RepID=A0AA37P1K6_9PEZI|nr:uncharacterized protein ColSpa_05174 [Colletotrichum spaethianum]GKT44993.1 hypothetical protein ColSpa_05174 [Colletotrichum spaethianum]